MKLKAALILSLILVLLIPEANAFLEYFMGCRCPKGSVGEARDGIDTAAFYASVICVEDGDTICVTREDDGTHHKIRLHGVDCPEEKDGQPYGREATQFTRKKVKEKTVKIFPEDKRDDYGRVVATVHYKEAHGKHKSLNEELVRAGLAWHYVRYAPNHSNYINAELEAKKDRRGLFADSNSIPPWKWRADKKTKAERTVQKTTVSPSQHYEEKPARRSYSSGESESSGPYRPVIVPSSTGYESTSPRKDVVEQARPKKDHSSKEKTVHVQEYQKKDGTVVKEHYRSAPTHHEKKKK